MRLFTGRSTTLNRRLWLSIFTGTAMALVIIMAATPVASQPRDIPAAQDAWLTYLADAARTSASDALIGTIVSPRWTHVVSGLIASEPVIANNRVYVSAWDGYLYALDRFDGHELWRRFLGTYRFKVGQGCGTIEGYAAGITAGPTYDPGSNLLYISAMSATVVITNGTPTDRDTGPYFYAIQADNGNIAWQAPLSANNDNYAWSSPLIANGHAYIGVASAGDCPLTQGQLVSLELGGAHNLKRTPMAPDALTVYPTNLVTSNDPPTTTLLLDGSDYNFTATASVEYLSPTSATVFIRLRHAQDGVFYRPELRQRLGGDSCETGLTFVQYLDDQKQADSSGVLVFSRTLAMDTTSLTDGDHFLVVPNLVQCSPFVAGIGGGIWSSPTYEAQTNRVYVTTGTPTPPCVPAGPCTGARSTVGPRSAAVVALNADTLAVAWSWQVPFAEQDLDADFGATPTLCTADNGKRILGVANKNGIFYAFDTEAPGSPVWQRRIAVGGGGPEVGQGSISSAACAHGVFYVGAGMAPQNASVCATSTGQVWALHAATGAPHWANPYCTSLVMGPVSAASGLVAFGANCRVLDCPRRLILLDQATGTPRFVGTPQTLAGLGDIISGIALVDGMMLVGDNPLGPGTISDGSRYFPPTATVRALNAWPGTYLPLVVR